MLSCRRLSKSAIQNTSALTFISKIESKLDGLKVFFIHNLLPSFECPACYCSVQTAIAINLGTWPCKLFREFAKLALTLSSLIGIMISAVSTCAVTSAG